MNLFNILDNELSRMHVLLAASLANSMRVENHHNSTRASNSLILYERIVTLQDVLLEAVKTHDKAIQEKVAELALTSKG